MEDNNPKLPWSDANAPAGDGDDNVIMVPQETSLKYNSHEALASGSSETMYVNGC